MSNPCDESQPFEAATYHEKCPVCGACNRVQVIEQYSHNQRQDYYCAHCDHALGNIRASVPPATSIVDDSRCQRQEVKNEA
jgi:rRNA maturation protein Nop10